MSVFLQGIGSVTIIHLIISIGAFISNLTPVVMPTYRFLPRPMPIVKSSERSTLNLILMPDWQMLTPTPSIPVLQAWLADRNLGERVDQSKGLAIPQTRYLFNGSYLRLKNITIGYRLPQRLTEKINISRLRFFVSGDNLFEWSGVKDFYDPEAITSIDDKLDPSSETGRGTGSGYAYPFQRRYSIGLNVDF